MKKDFKKETFILHVLPANTGRTYRFIKFIRDNFEFDKHKFMIDCSYLTAVKKYTKLLEFPDLLYVNPEPESIECKTFIFNIFKGSQHIIWHSLSFTRINPVALYSINKSFLKKSSWIENGFDIYATNPKEELKEIEVILRSKMKNIGSIAPINSDLIFNTYGKPTLNVSYPPDPMFYKLPELNLEHIPHSRKYKVIQLGTDTRVFSHPNDIIAYFKGLSDKTKKDRYCFILPKNIILSSDYVSRKTTPAIINKALSSFPTIMLKDIIQNKDEYINYYRSIDCLAIAPSTVLYPEYLFAPLFCGCSIYLIDSNKTIRKNFEEFSCFGKLGKISKKGLNVTLRDINELKKLSSILTVFFPKAIKAQWEQFFDAISKEGEA